MHSITLTEGMTEALREEMDRDDSVYIVGLGLTPSSSGMIAGLVDDFGISRVRSATEWAIRPAIPTAARISASAARAEKRVVRKRCLARVSDR